MNEEHFSIGCTGDVVVGDRILFKEATFTGSYHKPRFAGYRTIAAKVLKDSYGKQRAQHTFTLQVIDSEGTTPIEPGKIIKRKGRNVYKQGTKREPWPNEDQRAFALDEKHVRGFNAKNDMLFDRYLCYRDCCLDPDPLSFDEWLNR